MGSRGVKGPIIIAMKGPPCSGKSAVAWSLAPLTQSPIIAHDYVRDRIASLQQSMLGSPIEAAKKLDDLSFDAICRIASRQIRFGFHLIIDSSLSTRAHLDRLLQITNSTISHLVIVECNTLDGSEWRRRLESRAPVDAEIGKNYWYKPSTWEDLQKMLWLYPDYDTGDVSKIVVDTTDHVKALELCFAVQLLASSPQRHSIDYRDFAAKLATGIILTEGEAERRERQEREEGIRGTHEHILGICDEDGGNRTCRACLKPVSGPTYKCMQMQCELRLHKFCAELPHLTEIKPQDFPPFLPAIPRDYLFPEITMCKACESHHGKDYRECHECLYESLTRCAVLPSVLDHPCHEHTLQIKIVPISNQYRTRFICQACGDPGEHICYHCYECGFECHLSCGLLPHTSCQIHHVHPLSIALLPRQDDSEENICEENICDACEMYRNPKHWIYHCSGCEFHCHLNCMTYDAT